MKTLSSISAMLLLAGTMAQSQAVVVANWSLSNDASGYTGGSAGVGQAIDSVGGNNFGIANGPFISGGSVGGPSTSSTYLTGSTQFLYSTGAFTGPLVTLTDNFSITLYASIADLTNVGTLLTTAGGTPGGLQIGTDGSGNWVATIGSSAAGTPVGSVPAASGANAKIVFQRQGGVYSFSVNGVDGSTYASAPAFQGFVPGNGFFFGTSPGAAQSYKGYVSDITIATGPIPEPTTMALLLGVFGALSVLRRVRRKTA